MQFRRVGIALLALALSNCSSGSSSPPAPTTPISPWMKFRGDDSNTGQASVALAADFGQANPAPLIRIYAPDTSGGRIEPILASPAIGFDHTVYFATAGSESGTLYALKPQTTATSPLALKWMLTECVLPSGAIIPFGPIRSSPAITAVRAGLAATANNDKVLFFGDDTGHLYAVQDQGTTAICQWVFSTPDLSPISSSPLFVINTTDQTITSIVFGSEGGVFYALNGSDGSPQWQFHVPGGANSAISASPILDGGGPIYFPAADGNLYALSLDGTLIFSAPIGAVSQTFASSPARGSGIVVGTEDGSVYALLSNGIFQWRHREAIPLPIVASLGIGLTTAAGPTPTPQRTPTAGGSPTPTATQTPVLPPVRNIVFAIDAGGGVTILDEQTGEPDSSVRFVKMDSALTESARTNIDAGSVSSPIISGDNCIVFGDDKGMLNVIRFEAAPAATPGPTTPTPTPTTVPATPPCVTQRLQLTDDGRGITSSPAVDTDGVVYVGARDGRLYAVGTGTNP